MVGKSIQLSESNSENQPSDSNACDHENRESFALEKDSQNQLDYIRNNENNTNEIFDGEEPKDVSPLDCKNDVEDCYISESSTLEEHGQKAPTEEESHKKMRQINRKIKICVSVSGDDQVICDSNISSDPVSLDQSEYFFHFFLNIVPIYFLHF